MKIFRKFSEKTPKIKKIFRSVRFFRSVLISNLVYVALLLLTQCEMKSISSRFLLVVEKVKNKYCDHFQQKPHELNVSEYEVLKNVLICYCKLVSFEIVNSTLQVEKSKREGKRINNNLVDTYGADLYTNLRKSQLVYHPEVIEKFVVNYLLAHLGPSSDIKHEDLFNKIFDSLNHLNVRQKLKEIFDEHYIISFDKRTNEYFMRGLNDKLPERVRETNVNPNNVIRNELLVSSRKPIPTTISLNTNNDVQLVSSSNYKNNDSYVSLSNAPVTNVSSFSIVPLNLDASKFNYEQFKASFLNFHNRTRKQHQAGELEEATWLSTISQIHANFLAQYDRLTPSSKKFGEKTLGENLGTVEGVTNQAVESLLKEWHEKSKTYDFQNPKLDSEASNFTQMIWKGTTQVGFGVAFSKNGKAYVTVNYYPQGNALDGFRENVKPASY